MTIDEGEIRKTVQAVDDETLRVWKSEVIREVWTRGLNRRQGHILIHTGILSDEDLKHGGFSDEAIRHIRLAEKAKKGSL